MLDGSIICKYISLVLKQPAIRIIASADDCLKTIFNSGLNFEIKHYHDNEMIIFNNHHFANDIYFD